MKKLIYILLLVFASCASNFRDESTVCVVTEVTYYPIGSISVAQVDPKWKIKTDCNLEMSMRRSVSVGDTITIIKRKFIK
jgi:hypothetical protein